MIWYRISFLRVLCAAGLGERHEDLTCVAAHSLVHALERRRVERDAACDARFGASTSANSPERERIPASACVECFKALLSFDLQTDLDWFPQSISFSFLILHTTSLYCTPSSVHTYRQPEQHPLCISLFPAPPVSFRLVQRLRCNLGEPHKLQPGPVEENLGKGIPFHLTLSPATATTPRSLFMTEDAFGSLAWPHARMVKPTKELGRYQNGNGWRSETSKRTCLGLTLRLTGTCFNPFLRYGRVNDHDAKIRRAQTRQDARKRRCSVPKEHLSPSDRAAGRSNRSIMAAGMIPKIDRSASTDAEIVLRSALYF